MLLVELSEGVLDLGGGEVPEDQGRHERHREADARARELEERQHGLEEAEPGDDHGEEPCPRLERPQADRREDPDDPDADRQPAPEARGFVLRQVTEDPEPIEPQHSQAEEEKAEPGKHREDPSTEIRIGGLRIESPPWWPPSAQSVPRSSTAHTLDPCVRRCLDPRRAATAPAA